MKTAVKRRKRRVPDFLESVKGKLTSGNNCEGNYSHIVDISSHDFKFMIKPTNEYDPKKGFTKQLDD